MKTIAWIIAGVAAVFFMAACLFSNGTSGASEESDAIDRQTMSQEYARAEDQSDRNIEKGIFRP
jgi:hypothetical protein